MYGWKQDYGTSLNKSGIVEIAFSLLFLLSCRNPFHKLESKLERSFGVFGRHATQSFGNKYPLHLGLPTPLQCKTSLNGKKSKNQTIQQYSQTSSNITSWSPLQQNYFKWNLDAATFSDNKSFGAGACLRDSKGNFMKAITFNVSGMPSPKEAEVWALSKAISWIHHLNIMSYLSLTVKVLRIHSTAALNKLQNSILS